MKPSARIAVVALLLLSTGVLAAPASAGNAKQAAVKEAIHNLQVGIHSFAVDYDDLCPRFVSDRQFKRLLDEYVGDWPDNPNTGRPMHRVRGGGDFGYRLSRDRTHFLLIGWGRDGTRIVVVS